MDVAELPRVTGRHRNKALAQERRTKAVELAVAGTRLPGDRRPDGLRQPRDGLQDRSGGPEGPPDHLDRRGPGTGSQLGSTPCRPPCGPRRWAGAGRRRRRCSRSWISGRGCSVSTQWSSLRGLLRPATLPPETGKPRCSTLPPGLSLRFEVRLSNDLARCRLPGSVAWVTTSDRMILAVGDGSAPGQSRGHLMFAQPATRGPRTPSGRLGWPPGEAKPGDLGRNRVTDFAT